MLKATDEGLLTYEEGEARPIKRRLLLNFAAICIMWIFSFTAYSGLQNLESSLNPGVGVYSLAALTGGGLVSCLLAPVIISYIGSKGALVISWIALCIYVGANYYPAGYVLIPGAGIEGLATGLMWTAQGALVTSIAMEYARITEGSFDHILSKFFGIFCAAFQSTQIWGNLISSLVLVNGNSSLNVTTPDYCGRNFCPITIKPETKNTTKAGVHPESKIEIILLSVYMGFAAVGLIITVIMLRPMKQESNGPTESFRSKLVSTVRLLVTNSNMAMLVPFYLWTGLEQTIVYAEFTMAYVTCEIGIEWIGYTMICFGVTNTIGSPISGFLSKHVGRPTLFIIAMALNIGALIAMELWHLARKQLIIFFVIPGIWGLADSIWQTQSAALVGLAFSDKQEPAFSNLRMFQALGFTIGYLYSNHLCEYLKLYIAGGELVLSMILVFIVEIRLRRNSPKTTNLVI
ncbi:protein unc-93 homolog A-like [Saccostrea echinata]|uniref:protein unc-93 homolog A-like n=1 Tax=Saccostrea echinata TaxID=191078 RepID=UPI002A8263FC|nr:protein unc-93 homolog A-like [Saccostrea echinata]